MMAPLERGMRMWALVCAFLFVSAGADAEMARYDIDPEHTTTPALCHVVFED